MQVKNCFRMLAAAAFSALILVGCGGDDDNSEGGGGGGGGGDGGGNTFTDSRDGKVYNKLTIGAQTWMAENLNYNASGSVCYNNSVDSCAKYGRLYTWDAAMVACPAGWHLPSNAEWTTLTDFVGASTAGRKLKATEGWFLCGPAGSGKPYACEDTYGFSALPGGNGDWNGDFSSAGDFGYWWSATETDAGYALYRRMSYDDGLVREATRGKTESFAARCVANVRQ